MSRLDETFANDVRAALESRRTAGVWPLLAVLLLLLGLAGAWAHFALIEEVTTGDGRVIPSSQIQVVQPLEGGLVAEINVHEGDIVEAGQPLVRIDDTGFASTLGELRTRRAALEARARRLEAEAYDLPLDLPAGNLSPELIAGETALFEARRAALEQELAVNDQKLAQRRLEKIEMETRLEQTTTTVELLNKELDKARDLQSKGAFAELELLRLERQAQTEKMELAVLEASIPRTSAAIAEAMALRASAIAGFRAKGHEELSQTRGDLSVIEETIRAAEDKVRRTILRAPLRGIINKLSVTTIGAVVRPGEAIAEIVPLDDKLLIEARVRPQDVAFLHPGQDASVKVTAYDYTVYGDLPGKVERISPDTITDEDGNTFYRVIVRTDKTYLGTESEPLPIIPGMVVSTAILTGRKSVLDYLLKPIIKARSEALRER
ncbi:HlyD family type I secretion periplasmic adaptor subunit [Breoghania sp. L-A4]|uniref:HlyD family type I secretion periplasmic adaptor subunit n=1 Tax=Breoghania sp. L-A4 TaxID=2304600 RepID=UPI000E35B4A9|nr:HlyD family type I secretion periplasmic adaptor subunit [Breoghania sp. L-A4]AXS42135.1 HlyD family type I secretion periplasmic adaptor subunit [Breoghania sp. L-A4]